MVELHLRILLLVFYVPLSFSLVYCCLSGSLNAAAPVGSTGEVGGAGISDILLFPTAALIG